MNKRLILFILILAVIVIFIWLLPLSGDVFVMLDEPEEPQWPLIEVEPEVPLPGKRAELIVTDTVPWVHVLLHMENAQGRSLGEPALLRAEETPAGWEWHWRFTVPNADSYQLLLYHDCDRGCVLWGRKTFSNSANEFRSQAAGLPTKLCTIFPNPERDWHGRSGWVIELTYAQLADNEYWGVADVAQRVQTAVRQGHRVLLRVEYDQTQSLPAPADEEALMTYLNYIRRLARDDRLRGVYGLVIGSGFNSLEHNALAPDNPVTAEWAARVLNGYDTAVTAQDNVVAVVRAENPGLRVLAGAVQPWVLDQDGARPYAIDAPWLNYMNTFVASLDNAAQIHATAGIPLTAPDGFAIQAPGNPDSPKMGDLPRALEPQTDLISSNWHGAQLGFRIYRDWLDIINSASSTAGKPVYITASNTYGADNVGPPSENYPAGWLTQAMAEIDSQAQVHSLCWFADYFPYGDQWDAFSLTNPQGQMTEAALDFERILEEEVE